MIPNEYERKDWKKGQTFQKMKCLSFEGAKLCLVTHPPNIPQNFSQFVKAFSSHSSSKILQWIKSPSEILYGGRG